MKTLKYEEVYRNEYRDLPDAYARSASSWNASTIKNGCTRLWAMYRLPSSSKTAGVIMKLLRESPNGGAAPTTPGFIAFPPE